MARWLGWKALIHDGVDATVSLVAEGHASAGRTTVRALSLVPGLAAPARGVDAVRAEVTGAVLDSVRLVNRSVQLVTDLALEAAGPFGGAASLVPQRADAPRGALVVDAAVGAVNGVIGDHLHRRDNPLDLGLALRLGDAWLDPAAAAALGRRVVVFVHGLATTEWCWSLDADVWLGACGESFGTRLERDHGLTPVFVRYNTGRAIPDSGHALADALEGLVAGNPQVEELVLVGHSMGGLVARAALARDGAWRSRVSTLIALGSPHRGAPLERFADAAAAVLDAIDLPGTRIPAAVLRARSDGIQDLRHGTVGDGKVPEHVRVLFVAATVGLDPAHPVAEAFGDGMVPVDSALGVEGARVTTARVGGVPHHLMQVHPLVYEVISGFLTDGAG
jgi:pimeloyl-ACP methyl ester carboxylesterase